MFRFVNVLAVSAIVLSLNSNDAKTVPALSVSVPTPMAVKYSYSSGTVAPANTTNVLINVSLNAGACTTKVLSFGLGKTNDKNSTTYPLNLNCPAAGAAFNTSISASPTDLLPATAGRDFKLKCTSSGITVLVSIPMTAILYGPVPTTIASTVANIPFSVNCVR